MAKIAVALQAALDERRRLGVPGCTTARNLARGGGWSVADVVCTSGPRDPRFEERHTGYSIAVVLAGTFQYRADGSDLLMTPGSLLLGNAGQCFECGHEHAEGDRCVSFSYTRDCFEQLMADAGHKRRRFAVPRVPALRALAPVVARTAATLVTDRHDCWEELSVRVADAAAGLATGSRPHYRAPRNAEARVTRCVRAIDERPESTLTLDSLAHETGLSRYHFLRTFVRLTGITPHQYVLRARLRHAAIRLSVGRTRVLDIAFDCGFGDLSNFNRAFRAEFGASPRSFQVRRA